MKNPILRFILGDQLSHNLSSLADADPSQDVILMCEVKDEATSVQHHKKKIAFIFSAMRHFAKELEARGFQVRYVALDDTKNSGSFHGEVLRAIEQLAPKKVIMTEASEYRVLQTMQDWDLACPLEIRPDDRFLSSKEEFKAWAEGRKQLRMEFFYREMRRKYNVLMDGDQPVGGAWNFDAENRKPPVKGLDVPETFHANPDTITQSVLSVVGANFSHHFGDLEPFHFAVTRNEALQALDQFIDKRLSHFGDYQDAMIMGEPWMYHSHISFYLNVGLLGPLECVQAAEQAFHDGRAPLNAVEGFIRQILGWREFVRGIYWLKMPDYAQSNFLEAVRKLPPLFWGAPTQMNCLAHCVRETKENAYAHHIQRLMVLGNFALLAGLNPREVNEWYLIVYADAFEWVEMPNVSGMVLFADGGVLGSKPYAASGAYINRMSNYCGSCRYKVAKKNGPEACPFNYLYWDFLIRNQHKLRGNPRLAMPFRTLARMGAEKIDAVQADASRFLKALDHEEKV